MSKLKPQRSKSNLHPKSQQAQQKATPKKAKKVEANQSTLPFSADKQYNEGGIGENRSRLLTSSNKNTFEEDLVKSLKDIISNEEKLNSFIEIFEMLKNQQEDQRCLQHNNVLTLYCATERRILCVNCMYGAHKHRTHRVFPLKDSMNDIQDDNEKLQNIISEDLISLQKQAKIVEYNQSIISKEMKKSLQSLDREYYSQLQLLDDKHRKSKKNIHNIFEPLLKVSEKLTKQISDYKYKVWEVSNKYAPTNNSTDSMIIKQLLFVSIVDLHEIKVRLLDQKDLDRIHNTQKKSVKRTNQSVSRSKDVISPQRNQTIKPFNH